MHLLDETTAEAYLRQQGWVTADERVVVWRLTGGVSNEVLYVSRPDRKDRDFVVKQARPQLRTPQPWFSSVERIWREVEVLRICQRLLLAETQPEATVAHQLIAATPRVLHEDRDNYAFAMSAAPADHRVWKADLLGGRVEPVIAEACGRLLGRLHAGTWHDADVAAQLDDRRLYDELRLDPYYRSVVRTHPGHAAALERLIDQTWHERHSLVHADFSPKNLLVYEGGLLLVDFETGHYGDPAFDLGFFLSHLMLKAAYHAPAHAAYLDLSRLFWKSYLAEMEGAISGDERRQLERRAIDNFAGCAWARLDGKSQVDYLTDAARRDVVRTLCQQLLNSPADDWEEVLEELDRRL
ncbi:MAG TPA: aminoglycoside phosphotransferase family protein [Pirellulales bacterium]|nr:aminoglycoside phosphotransferase family protein [Pirellulales bacterium]